MKKILILLITLLLILFILGAILHFPSKDLISFSDTQTSLDAKTFITKYAVDIYGINTISLDEGALNSFIEPMVKDAIHTLNTPNFIKFTGYLLEIRTHSIILHLGLKTGPIPLKLDVGLLPISIDNELGTRVKSLDLGHIPLPLVLLDKYGANSDSIYYLTSSSSFLDAISIHHLTLENSKLIITFSINRDIFIDRYIEAKYQKSLKEAYTLLAQSSSGRKFANTLTEILVYKYIHGFIPQKNIVQLQNDFNALSISTKAQLIIILANYPLTDLISMFK